MTPRLEVRGATVAFSGRHAVSAVDLAIEPGEVVALLGPSGSGKSTLLRAVAGLQRLDAGTVLVDGHEVADVPPHRRGIGLMFQDHALFPHRDVGANVAFGLRMQGASVAEQRQRTAELLELVGLPGTEGRRIQTLSGGEQQRVALTRSLAPEPRVLLLDEPLGALDRPLRARLVSELRALFTQLSLTVLAVTHDQSEAFALADRLVLLDSGRVLQSGPPAEVWDRPASVRAAELLGFANIGPFPGEVDGPPVLVRAEGVHVGAGGPLPAVVRSATFAGARTRLVLELASGRRLEADVPTPTAPRVDTTVTVLIDADAVVPLEP